ncbi:hypothetical protein BDZ85DRAFT_280429 [Elsinoe ampelina]|uniref:SGNH hydrolase-type esterase domain-containing protein n=1 Tax=Elsinoe ampelina TaxID=302913 RepID=A0A6A6GID9_9PEZI|nr:hypothetical protein BDZ85DRAFT_280429 [Elsinoe ampelina]
MGQQQIKRTGEPRVVIMTIGGNNAGFANIVTDCMYQPFWWRDYEGPFPDDGKCAAAIAAADRILDDTIGTDITNTYIDIFNHFKDMPSDLNVYHTSYIPFFNTEDNWCRDESFAVYPLSWKKEQKLNVEIRTAMNNLVTKMNNIIDQAVRDFQPRLAQSQRRLLARQKDLSDTGPVIPDRPDPPAPPPATQPFQPPIQPVVAKRNLGFIDLSETFSGHRFCETNSDHTKQYYGNETYLWNLNYFGTREVPADGKVPALTSEQKVQMQTGELAGESGSGTDNSISNGWHLRPFHPTARGNEAIKDAIVQRLVQDQIPGVKSLTSMLNGEAISGSVLGGILAGLRGIMGKGA